MSDHHQDRSTVVAELLDSVRRLMREDPESIGQLVREICRDESMPSSSSPGLCREAVALAKFLRYPDWEVIDAVHFCGLVTTIAFLRREAEQLNRAAGEPISARIM